MKISGQNKLAGEILAIKKGEIECQITLKSGENMIVSVITRDSAEEMGLKVGDHVVALIKSTEVMIMK
ncbi:TOBE domain-containing protein [Ferrovum myxofaciens]|jgi:molybdopterin-binding protein|uniref:Molybdenum-pterin-binding protein 2 n=2 Tax=root TaxID=1 RepID=A0A8F3DW80_9PROT|nr:TOBE domain-containing protein [Ferrovum myxofaciens]KXW58074.1 molybdenum-pterin-binding protein 2 [Ferrovum myxofaciens]MBU6995627.1 TOBE domain-containing protein [Ferrovum myxofaciens]QKE39589.1 MAG: TOBE domain-containing protein [Ferrovum myxofaciens]QKE39902.1 MAG: TOBE domain-containing protein [Ferrovum myxofaciens]QWY74879.1 MAG: TOBE domain-containing protein [Ferrovum myxofaciens]